ncbi:MAG TPA: zf-TFIIB domain-containing protein [Myxococcales bacterium]|nr:zf-TFIIB domain-containing protein [Myxococcales bacterium]
MSKPTQTEEEYFARENAERLRKLAAEQKKTLAQGERDELKQLHQMRCPKCGMELKEIAVRGVQVDRCFCCNGTWLDAGELEKLGSGQSGESVMSSILRVFSSGKK